jgi:hypothetical protein
MPVISSKARASVPASYSCVVSVSETTEISMPRKGAAALMNHSISAICSSLLSDDGWNSLSIQRSAAAISALTGPLTAKSAAAAIAAVNVFLMASPPLWHPSSRSPRVACCSFASSHSRMVNRVSLPPGMLPWNASRLSNEQKRTSSAGKRKFALAFCADFRIDLEFSRRNCALAKENEHFRTCNKRLFPRRFSGAPCSGLLSGRHPVQHQGSALVRSNTSQTNGRSGARTQSRPAVYGQE